METEEILLLEPDEVDFLSLDIGIVRELALAEQYGDSRMQISALGELSQRAYRDKEVRRSTILVAQEIINGDDPAPHLYAYALSVLYWHRAETAIAAVVKIARTCSDVVLWDIVDLLAPDLGIRSSEPDFRAAASAVAERLKVESTAQDLPLEGIEYLELYASNPHLG